MLDVVMLLNYIGCIEYGLTILNPKIKKKKE